MWLRQKHLWFHPPSLIRPTHLLTWPKFYYGVNRKERSFFSLPLLGTLVLDRVVKERETGTERESKQVQ